MDMPILESEPAPAPAAAPLPGAPPQSAAELGEPQAGDQPDGDQPPQQPTREAKMLADAKKMYYAGFLLL